MSSMIEGATCCCLLTACSKSQLAIEYAFRFRERADNSFVLWLHASSASRLEQSVRNALDDLKVPDRNKPNAQIFRLLRSWLREAKAGRKWLVIIDNADDPRILDEPPSVAVEPQGRIIPTSGDDERRIDYLPVCDHGTVLLTARSRDAALSVLQIDDIIQVDPMNEVQACALLVKRLGSVHQCDHIELCALSRRLDHMPLALSQAASYIRQRAPRCSVLEYIRKLDKSAKSQRSLLSRNDRNPRRDRDSINSIFLTWEITFKHIRQKHPSAADLLSLMSFFDRQAIPQDIIRNREPTLGMRLEECLDGIRAMSDRLGLDPQFLVEVDTLLAGADPESESSLNDLPRVKGLLDLAKSAPPEPKGQPHENCETVCHDDSASDTDSEDFEDDLQVLLDYSLVAVTAESSVFEMHRLVQLATQRWLDLNGRYEHWAACFVRNLDDALPFSQCFDFALFAICRKIHPHAVIASNLELVTQDTIEQRATLSGKMEYYHLRRGALADAEVFATHELAACRAMLRQRDASNLAFLCDLGESYFHYTRDTAKESLTRREIDLTQFPGTILRMNFLKILVQIYMVMKRPEEAGRLRLMREETIQDYDGVYDLEMLDWANSLGEIYDELAAAEDEEQPLARKPKLAGRKSLEVRTPLAHTLYVFVSIKAHLETHGKEEEFEGQALEKSMIEFGDKHVIILAGMMQLAKTQMEAGQSARAIGIIRECATQLYKQLGPQHQMTFETLKVLKDCSNMHKEMEEFKQRKEASGSEEVRM